MSLARTIARILLLIVIAAGLGFLVAPGVAHAQALAVTQPNPALVPAPFNGTLRGTATPLTSVSWTLAPDYSGTNEAGSATADAAGSWQGTSLPIDDPDGTEYTLTVTSDMEQVTMTVIKDTQAPNFSINNWTTILATTPTVALSYYTNEPVTVQPRYQDGTPVGSPFAITTTGLSTVEWRPPTPAFSSATYTNITFEATDSAGNTATSGPFTVTHTPGDMAGLVIKLSNNGVALADGVTTPPPMTATLTLDGAPRAGVHIVVNGIDKGPTDGNGQVTFSLQATSGGQTLAVMASDAGLNALSYIAFVPPNYGAVDMLAFGSDGLDTTGTVVISIDGTPEASTSVTSSVRPPLILSTGQIQAAFTYAAPDGNSYNVPHMVTLADQQRIQMIFRTGMLVQGAFDGRGIGPTYRIEGFVPTGSTVTAVEYVVGGDWTTGTPHPAQVDARGHFVLTGQLSGTPPEGTLVPVHVRVAGDTTADISFQAMVDLTAPDVPSPTVVSQAGGIAFQLTGGLHDNYVQNIDHLVLQYTTDTTSPTPRWDAITLPATLTQPSNADGTFDGLWIPPQTGAAHPLNFRLAAVDYAGLQSAWSTTGTVAVPKLSVGVSSGSQVLTPDAENGVSVVATVDGAPIAGLQVDLADQTQTTNAAGQAGFPVNAALGDQLVAVVSTGGQTVAKIPFFALDARQSQGGVFFSLNGINGDVSDFTLEILQNVSDRYHQVQTVSAGSGTGLILPAGTYEALVTAAAPGTDDPVTHVTRPAQYYVHQSFTVTSGQAQAVQLNANGLASLNPTWTVTDSGLHTVVPDQDSVAISPFTTATSYLPPVKLAANREILAASDTYVLRYNFSLGTNIYSVVRTAMTGDASGPTFSMNKDAMAGVSPAATASSEPWPTSLTLSDPAQPQMAVGEEGIAPGTTLWVEPGTYNYEDGMDVQFAADAPIYHFYFTGLTPLTLSSGVQELDLGGSVTGTLTAESGTTTVPGGQIELSLNLNDAYGEPLSRVVTEEHPAPGISLFTDKDQAPVRLFNVSLNEDRSLGMIGLYQFHVPFQIPYDLDMDWYDLKVDLPELGEIGADIPAQSVTVEPGMALVAQLLPGPGSQSLTNSLLPNDHTAQLVVHYFSPNNPSGYTIDSINGSFSVGLPDGYALTGADAGPALQAKGMTVSIDGSNIVVHSPPSMGLHLTPGDAVLTATIQTAGSGEIDAWLSSTDLDVYVDGTLLPYDASGDTTYKLGSVLLAQVNAPVGTPAAMAWLNDPWSYQVGSKFQVDDAADLGPGQLITLRAGYLPDDQPYAPDPTVNMSVNLTYGDVNGDRKIDQSDLDMMTQYLHADPGPLPLDPAGAGRVSLKDLVIAARNADGTTHSLGAPGQIIVDVDFGGGDVPQKPVVDVFATDPMGSGVTVPVAAQPITLSAGTGTLTFTDLPRTYFRVTLANPGWTCTQSDGYSDPQVDLTEMPHVTIQLTCAPATTVVVRHPGSSASNQFAVARGDVWTEGGIQAEQYGYPWADLYEGEMVSASGFWAGSAKFSSDGAGQDAIQLPDTGGTYQVGVQNRQGGTIDPGTTLTVYYGDQVVAQVTAAGAAGSGSEWLAVEITLNVEGTGPPEVTVRNEMTPFTDKPVVTTYGDTR